MNHKTGTISFASVHAKHKILYCCLLLIIIASCHKDKHDSPPPAPPVLPGKMEIVSGDNQTGTPGLVMRDTILIKVTPQKAGDEQHYSFFFATGVRGTINATATIADGVYYIRGLWTMQSADSLQQIRCYLFANCDAPFSTTACAPIDSVTISAVASRPWQTSYAGAPGYGAFQDMYFSDNLHGIVVGDNAVGIMSTGDGGKTWTPKSPPRNDYSQLAFTPGGDTGLIIVSNNNAYITDDGGNIFYQDVWTPPLLGDRSSRDFAMMNRDTLITVGALGHIAKSVDGGKTWTDYTGFSFINTLYSITCPNPGTCYACGIVGKVIKTTDGGDTWREQPVQLNNNLAIIYFLDGNTGFAGGQYGALIRTTDGGSHWSPISSNLYFSIMDIRFFSATLGYIVSSSGEIAKTTDGGLTWKKTVSDNNGVFTFNKAYIKDSTLVFGLQNNSIFQHNLQ